MIENADPSLVDWSRAQFALTAIYHWIFVPLTLGLSFILAIMETIYVRTGNEEWKSHVKFWMTLFGINFAIGVATGIILEFEFGTNWSNYSWFVGDIFGAPLAIEGIKQVVVPARNVLGVLEGSDPKLKNEYLVVSAHYDHVGVQKNAKVGTDSIFNGARDNAIGVVGMLATAKYLSQYPPKRSVLFVAWTAEEKGLLGSKYYSENPVIPMKQTVFNFNCDGAGYNDITAATIIGMERTTAESDLFKACQAFGLKATVDPVPEQNLFERSDNYYFAVKGVPAISFSPGVKSFDAELMKYYHKQADEVSSLDFDYLIKYFRAYVYSNVLLSSNPKVPVWKSGDKFEAEAKKLYGK